MPLANDPNYNMIMHFFEEAASIHRLLLRWHIDALPEDENERKVQRYYSNKLAEKRDKLLAHAITSLKAYQDRTTREIEEKKVTKLLNFEYKKDA